ncbi:hypothetical protein [Pedobacter ginsengisoli]|uniref:hypothetical protein n=1 Tax=Pedobacter ginsengisoli TaxID=363852 RepID=UPI00254F9503|nr:hypothetical protein [Pedobacter ginsengisoli]
MFICECNFFGTQIEGHMNYVELEKLLSEFSCKRMLSTHFGREMQERLDELEIGYLADGV